MFAEYAVFKREGNLWRFFGMCDYGAAESYFNNDEYCVREVELSFTVTDEQLNNGKPVLFLDLKSQ